MPQRRWSRGFIASPTVSSQPVSHAVSRAWDRDFSSPEAYAKSVAPNRERFLQRIGAVGPRVAPVELSFVSAPDSPAKVAEDANLSIFAVRWTVYPGVEAEGLLLEPKGTIKANVVAMPDCAIPPEQYAGIAPGLPARLATARGLALEGCRVLVPTLIDRSDEFSGNPKVRMTNLPHREWIYRQAYETGRHIIGYEVDEVRGHRLVHPARPARTSDRSGGSRRGWLDRPVRRRPPIPGSTRLWSKATSSPASRSGANRSTATCGACSKSSATPRSPA